MRAVFAAALMALSFGVPFGVPAAHADAQQYLGDWQCNMGNRPAPGGQIFDLWMYTYKMNLTGQGNFTAEGTYEAASAGFAVPFSIKDGTWEEAEGGMLAKGKWTNNGEPQDFFMAANPQADGTLSFSTTSSHGTVAVFCKR